MTSSLRQTNPSVITVLFIDFNSFFTVMRHFNAEGRSLIRNLRTDKGWGLTRMIKELPNKMWKRRAVDYLIKKIDLVVVC